LLVPHTHTFVSSIMDACTM